MGRKLQNKKNIDEITYKRELVKEREELKSLIAELKELNNNIK